jgi:hypothetical protein
VAPAMLDELKEIASARKVDFNKEQYEQDLRFIKAFTKAFIARRLWGNEGYSRVMLVEDAQFKKAFTLFPEAEKIAGKLSSLR